MSRLFRSVLTGLLLIGILAAGQVTKAGDPAAEQLQQRVDALAQQIRFRHRLSQKALKSSQASFATVLTEWNRAVEAGADQENLPQLEAWLDRSLRSTMPGANGQLPVAPQFVVPVSSVPPTVANPPEVTGPNGKTYETDAVDATTRPALQQQTADLAKSEAVAELAPGETFSGSDADKRMKNQQANQPTVKRQEVAKPISAQRSKWSRHPAAAPLEWTNPFVDDDQASSNPLRTGPKRRWARRPVISEGTTIAIDLSELSARVRGYRLAVQELKLMLTSGPILDPFELADISEELDSLVEEKRFIDLYHESLSIEDQRTVPTAPSTEIASELLRRRIVERLATISSDQLLEHKILERLSDQLARQH